MPEPGPRVERHRPDRIPDDGVMVDTRMAARTVEAILHRCFTFPEKLRPHVADVASEIANAMCATYAQTNELYWKQTEGSC
jgi:hypothetical protein